MKKEKKRCPWALIITIWTFFLSMIISVLTNTIIQDVSIAVAFVVLICVIFFGIIFDVIGIAVATGSEIPFHAKSTKKHRGSKEAIILIRNAEKVSNFCNDVIGDIAGVISGGLAGVIVSIIHTTYPFLNAVVINLILTAVVAAATVGGKAIGKGFAINKSDDIILKVAVVIYYFKKVFKRN